MDNDSGLLVQRVSFSISGQTILDKATVSIPSGATLALLGTSGSGKTSLLRIIAGFLAPDAGRVFVDNRDVTDVSPEVREISMLFQQPALFPKRTILDNALAARVAKRSPQSDINEARSEILGMIDEFRLTAHKRKIADALSGGEFQRAAIVRCLANATKSKLLLLDEPFQSNLNLSMRWSLMEWVKDWLKRRELTCLFVTHDFAEAAFLSSRIAVLDEVTHSITMGDSSTLYNSPPNLAIARIVGPLNEWELRKFAYKLPIPELQQTPVSKARAEWCMCRPSSVGLEPEGTGFKMRSQTFLGSFVRIELNSLAQSGFTITADVPARIADGLQKSCGVRLRPDDVSFYDDQEELIGST